MVSFQLLLVLAVITAVTPVAGAEPLPQLHEVSPQLEEGWLAYQRGDLEAALHAYQHAVSASPEDASLWYDLGCLYALTRDPGKARDALHRAVSLNPKLAEAHDALGQLDEQGGDLDRAQAFYASASALEPDKAKFLQHLARIQVRLDEVAARKTLVQLLRLEPANVEARYTLGVLQLRANEPDHAIHNFHQVLERFPQHVMAWNGLALASLRIGALDEAAKALEQAKRLEPNHPSTQSNLGLLAASAQHWEEARKAWGLALKLNPRFAPAAQNLEALNMVTQPSSP